MSKNKKFFKDILPKRDKNEDIGYHTLAAFGARALVVLICSLLGGVLHPFKEMGVSALLMLVAYITYHKKSWWGMSFLVLSFVVEIIGILSLMSKGEHYQPFTFFQFITLIAIVNDCLDIQQAKTKRRKSIRTKCC